MAKKVKVGPSEVRHENIEKNVEAKGNHSGNNSIILIIAIISVLANGILGYLTYDYYQKSVELDDVKNELESTESELEDVHSSLFSLVGTDGVYYTRNKLDFLDENIVFKIEGFGNYYYTYDCMMKKVDGNYSFWAYNINAAQGQGLKKGSC